MAYIQTYTKQFNSMADCVKVDILGFPFYKADDGRIHAVPVEEHIQTTTKLWTLERNHFPYALEEGIEHWVIWTLGECEMPEDEMIRIFNNEFKGAEYIHLTNPPSLKTVPEIHHSHVFVNRTGRSHSPTAVNALLSSPLRQSAEPFEEDEE
ncbi:hypothetical protein BCR33DRAFT_711429 [Rhizoclosmatium globosum]|uniref:Uncharacterized protein n=1 Tax=Rhizoclosmatium globosum TaxID=329046 RepID=A0A1Y2D1B4_9FUNG|nr:hypothetical protein BCR33DRAFT_711429 [Rhizoclosmatium globosum]|eukprot:ORY53040.1 hypothetical protein BCR33DRAFT_711429 [Rhizoclosmatium globosum]